MREVLSPTMSIELYERYLAADAATKFDGKYMPYEWSGLPKSLTNGWTPYSEMFQEFSREIANSLNQLTEYAHRLKVWSVLVSSMSDQEKLDAAHEFIDPLATVGLNLPYVIRSRFTFAVAHLCHQANRARDGRNWQDDFPLDSCVHLNTADKYGAGWLTYKPLKRRLERISDKTYQAKTRDFRNLYNHRFSPQAVIGITQIVERHVDTSTNHVAYTFKAVPPLTVPTIAELLRDQCDRSYAAFEAFQKLIKEHHEVSIAA